MEKSHTISSSLFTTIQFIVNTISLLFLYFEVLSILGQRDLGIWSMITALPTALTVFGSGVGGCILRNTPRYSANLDAKEFSKLFISGFLVNLASAIIIISLGLILSEDILKLLLSEKNVGEYNELFFLALLNIFFKYLSVVSIASLDGMQMFKARSIINIVSSVIQIILTIPAIFYFGLYGVLLLQLVQTLFVFIASLVYLFKTELFQFNHLSPQFESVKLILREGKNYQMISFSVLFFEPVSKYFIKKYTNYDVVSLYDISMRAASQIHAIINAGIQVIIPRVTELQTSNSLDMKSFFLKANSIGILASSFLFSTFSFVTIKSFKFVYAENQNLLALYIVALSVSYLICAISIVPYSILLGLGSTRVVLFSHFISTSINATLFLIISHEGNTFSIVLPPAISIITSALFLEAYFIKKYQIFIKDFQYEFNLGVFAIIFNCIVFLSWNYYNDNISFVILELLLYITLVGFTLNSSSIKGLFSKLLSSKKLI